MRRVRPILTLALVTLLATSGNAHARSKNDDDAGTGFLSNLSYSLALGMFFPGGDEGAELDPGGDARAAIHWEMTPGLVMGPEIGAVQSTDDLNIRIVHLGIHARIYPEPDYPNIYVHLGAAAYNVSYNPDVRTPQTPASHTRPGGSFGAGFEFNPYSKLSIGIEGIYHGIALSQSDALSYITATVTLTLRPYAL
jgi:opacity protein-like surface antigen